MNPRTLDEIRRYYKEFSVERIHAARLKVESEAQRLATRLREQFHSVMGPRVEPEAKCVELRATLNQPEPSPAGGAGAQGAGEPGPPLGIGIFLSWVARSAIVRTGLEIRRSDRTVVAPPVSVKKLLWEAREFCVREVETLGFEVLSEEDLLIPVDIDVQSMKEKDGSLVLPPPQVGKCLFYPWWGDM